MDVENDENFFELVRWWELAPRIGKGNEMCCTHYTPDDAVFQAVLHSHKVKFKGHAERIEIGNRR